jgi:ribosomal protein S4E
MPTILQLRRGTTAEHSSFTGAEGEITVNTTKDTIVVHDGSTAGGFELALADGSNVTVSTEQIQDAAASMITSATHTNITATYDDAAGTLALAAAAGSAYGDSDVGTYLSSNGYGTSSSIIASITDSAPATLDTLNELAAALGDDANYASTTAATIAANRIDIYNAAGTLLN